VPNHPTYDIFASSQQEIKSSSSVNCTRCLTGGVCEGLHVGCPIALIDFNTQNRASQPGVLVVFVDFTWVWMGWYRGDVVSGARANCQLVK
jgi:hypothetical protein